ncbi:hypothetical protein OBBRIDRAFT_846635 [Obba rivulosa]|uniref:Protein kinase domain-containing protein n=1 Tax=Obba rivulosa TaxID=1052685 RepID=A0A8E2DRS2_9APHY|nr:hypothetical protein OBBRIDRAFT_846635 [Obba rivulosa]
MVCITGRLPNSEDAHCLHKAICGMELMDPITFPQQGLYYTESIDYWSLGVAIVNLSNRRGASSPETGRDVTKNSNRVARNYWMSGWDLPQYETTLGGRRIRAQILVHYSVHITAYSAHLPISAPAPVTSLTPRICTVLLHVCNFGAYEPSHVGPMDAVHNPLIPDTLTRRLPELPSTCSTQLKISGRPFT